MNIRIENQRSKNKGKCKESETGFGHRTKGIKKDTSSWKFSDEYEKDDGP